MKKYFIIIWYCDFLTVWENLHHVNGKMNWIPGNDNIISNPGGMNLQEKKYKKMKACRKSV